MKKLLKTIGLGKVKRSIDNLINKILLNYSKSEKRQLFMERIINKCEYYMGIGSGSCVNDSGEKIVFSLISSKNPIIFDVGANQGQFAKEALAYLKEMGEKKGRVFSFEPSLATYNMMKKNISDNTHVTYNIGMGKAKAVMTLHFDEEGSGLASLTKRDLDFVNKKFSKTEDVTINTIDDFCLEHNIQQIDLLKIDVEGHELDVLNGAIHMLYNTSVVMFEFGGCNIDTKTYFKDFYKFFNLHGMTIYRITPSGYLYKIDSYKEINEKFRTTNFIAKR